MSWDNNPYYNPEKFGLTTLGEVQWGEPCYSFDLTVVWRRESDGQLFMASDSGCSCPSPFENVDSIDDLTPVTRHEALAALQTTGAEHYAGSAADAAHLIEKLAAA